MTEGERNVGNPTATTVAMNWYSLVCNVDVNYLPISTAELLHSFMNFFAKHARPLLLMECYTEPRGEESVSPCMCIVTFIKMFFMSGETRRHSLSNSLRSSAVLSAYRIIIIFPYGVTASRRLRRRLCGMLLLYRSASPSVNQPT